MFRVASSGKGEREGVPQQEVVDVKQTNRWRGPALASAGVVLSAAILFGPQLAKQPTAAASTWTIVPMPNVKDHPNSALTQGQAAPYHIDWPGEGTSSTGETDPACSDSAPYGNGRHTRTDQLTGVQGIWKRGPFVRQGNPNPNASNHGANHLAFFFHTADSNGKPCYAGGSEYGFTRKLADGSTNQGDQPLEFYQCTDCNQSTQQYTSKVFWNYAASDRIYRVSFTSSATCALSSANFLVEVVDPSNFQVVDSQVICRASWMPNLNGATGWITANAHVDKGMSDGVDDFSGSYNEVIHAKYLHN